MTIAGSCPWAVLGDGINDGFAPGEAAGFMLLISDRVIKKCPSKPLARVFAPAMAQEPGHYYSNEPYRGEGLAQAFGIALEQANRPTIGTVYSSMTGEHFWAKEYGVATLRHRTALDPRMKHEHPADCFGDIGAAAGPVMIGMAAIGMQHGYIKGPSLVYCASDTEHRAAVCLHVNMSTV